MAIYYNGNRIKEGYYNGQLVYRRPTKLIPGLPDDYLPLEYLQSSGTQYIDTGVKANGQTTDYEIEFHPTVESAYAFILSARETSAKNRFDLGWGKPSTPQLYLGYNTGSIDITSFTDLGDKKHVVKKSGSKITVDNDREYTVTLASFQTPVNMVLFANNNNGSLTNYAKAKLYSVKLSDNSALVRDFIPAKRKSDGVLGMYDLANSGKNLFDKRAITNGVYLNSSGQTVANSGWCVSNYMPVEGGETYYQVLSVAGSAPKTCWYDANKTFISSSNQVAGGTLTAPNNAKYCRMSVNLQQTTPDTETAMFYKGTSRISYEPFPFYTNAGTGTFIAGPVIEQVEYIDSGANRGYIITDYTPTLDTDIEVLAQKTGATSLFGSDTNVYTITGSGKNTTSCYVCGAGTNIGGDDFTKKIYSFKGGVVSVGAETRTITRGTTAPRYPLTLNARSTSATSANDTASNQKIWYVKVWENDVLVRHFVPVKLDTKYAIYDLVTHRTHHKTGGGDLTGGPLYAKECYFGGNRIR